MGVGMPRDIGTDRIIGTRDPVWLAPRRPLETPADTAAARGGRPFCDAIMHGNPLRRAAWFLDLLWSDLERKRPRSLIIATERGKVVTTENRAERFAADCKPVSSKQAITCAGAPAALAAMMACNISGMAKAASAWPAIRA